ncbi:MAG: 2-oxoglutarate dehydrogenase complex dihydrolipoyllysine-residue succinyltransferase [Myxococcota bacterium]
MAVDVKVPSLGESITEAIVLEWLVKPGDYVEADQDLVALETDKVTMNVPSPSAGVVAELVEAQGSEVAVGAIIARIDASASKPAAGAGAAAAATPAKTEAAPAEKSAGLTAPSDAAAKVPAGSEPAMMPAVRKLLAESGLDAAAIAGSGKDGRILKEDVLRAVADAKSGAAPKTAAAPAAAKAAPSARSSAPAGERERVVPMSRLRSRIAENLVSAQQNAALLTTFNEVDMTAVMALRKRYQDGFVAKHGIKLGFTSFFAKAVVEALEAFPAVNAEVRGDTIVYKNYYDIGVAVGGGRGLVVPVVRDADRLGFAEFEKALADLAERARDNKLAIEDLQGGTFTISNGGVYGSLLSTPIVNPPQSAILGLHKIEERPIALNGQVVIRPMMYTALTYDHRIIDGREAVGFLVRIKELVEDPERLLLGV